MSLDALSLLDRHEMGRLMEEWGREGFVPCHAVLLVVDEDEDPADPSRRLHVLSVVARDGRRRRARFYQEPRR